MLQALTSHKVPIPSLFSVYRGRHHEVVLGVLQKKLLFFFFLSEKESIREVCPHPDNEEKLSKLQFKDYS